MLGKGNPLVQAYYKSKQYFLEPEFQLSQSAVGRHDTEHDDDDTKIVCMCIRCIFLNYFYNQSEYDEEEDDTEYDQDDREIDEDDSDGAQNEEHNDEEAENIEEKRSDNFRRKIIIILMVFAIAVGNPFSLSFWFENCCTLWTSDINKLEKCNWLGVNLGSLIMYFEGLVLASFVAPVLVAYIES